MVFRLYWLASIVASFGILSGPVHFPLCRVLMFFVYFDIFIGVFVHIECLLFGRFCCLCSLSILHVTSRLLWLGRGFQNSLLCAF